MPDFLLQLLSWEHSEAIAQFMDSGGDVLWLILLVTILLWSLILERYWYIRLIFPSRMRDWVSEWEARDDHGSWYARRIRAAIISDAEDRMERTVPIILALIAICPLCGLLGTVTGMVQVFDVMSLKGTGNIRAMSAGVSAATIPTMAGMVVAISGLYFGSRLNRVAKRRTQALVDALKFD